MITMPGQYPSQRPPVVFKRGVSAFPAAVVLFFVMNPLGNAVLLLSLFKNIEPKRRGLVSARKLLITLAILRAFLSSTAFNPWGKTPITATARHCADALKHRDACNGGAHLRWHRNLRPDHGFSRKVSTGRVLSAVRLICSGAPNVRRKSGLKCA